MIFLGANIKYLRKLAGLTQGQLADKLGVNANTISNYEKGNSSPDFAILERIIKILDADAHSILYTDLTESGANIFATKIPENVLKHKEDKFEDAIEDIRKFRKVSSNSEYPKIEEHFEQNIADATVDKVFKLRTDRLIDRQQIPIYDIEAVAGLVPLFAERYNQSVIEVMETTLIPKCDGGLRIVGDSMYPLLKSGDIVFYKQIHDIKHCIIWGEMYLISFDIDGDEYVSVKYLQKSDIPDHVVLVSYNEHHKPMEIHISRIRALAFIKASLRLNSIK